MFKRLIFRRWMNILRLNTIKDEDLLTDVGEVFQGNVERIINKICIRRTGQSHFKFGYLLEIPWDTDRKVVMKM